MQPFATDRLWHHLDFSARPTRKGWPEDGQHGNVLHGDALHEDALSDYELDGDGLEGKDQDGDREWITLDQHVAELWARVDQVIAQGSAGRFQKVQSFSSLYGQGGGPRVACLLDEVSSTLRKLWLDQAHFETNDLDGPRGETLLFSLIPLRSVFPHLTDVYLGLGVVEFVEIIPILCQAAPSLASLDFSANSSIQSPIYSPASPTTPLSRHLAAETRLVRLRLFFDLNHNPEEPEDGEIWSDPVETLIDLIAHSPALRSLKINYSVWEVPLVKALADRVAALQQLEDLYWVTRPADALSPANASDVATFPAVRRMVLSKKRFQLPTEHVKPETIFPALEIVLFKCSDLTPRNPFPLPSAYLPLNPGSAIWFRQRPLLHTLHYTSLDLPVDATDISVILDDAERSANPTGTIHSICHNGNELLHLRLWLYFVRIPKTPNGRGWLRHPRVLFADYTGRGGTEYCLKRSEPEWQDFTYFDGFAVPLDVIERVKAVEDPAAQMDWDRRGVEVGDEAWRVLTEWKEKQSEIHEPWDSEEDSESVRGWNSFYTDDEYESEEDSDVDEEP